MEGHCADTWDQGMTWLAADTSDWDRPAVLGLLRLYLDDGAVKHDMTRLTTIVTKSLLLEVSASTTFA